LQRKIRWAVLSTSSIARAAVIPAIQHSTNGELVAVASRDTQRARDFAAKLAIPVSYGSYDALLSANDVNAICIPLPNILHREWSIKAAEAKKHVLCEKPLAMNSAECAEMDNAARRMGVKLMEAFMYRFHPQTQKVLELLRSGAIGDLRLIHSAFTFRVTDPANIRLQPELGGGSLMGVGCYCVNISRTIAGQEPIEVQAYANWSSTGVDNQMVGNLRFSNGLLACSECISTG
jgi:xylose dehydrogenase (NAD/NADP)